MALALVLAGELGLMIRSFQALRPVDPGLRSRTRFRPSASRFRRPWSPILDRVMRTQQEILDKIAAIPGVASVAFTTGCRWTRAIVGARLSRPKTFRTRAGRRPTTR